MKVTIYTILEIYAKIKPVVGTSGLYTATDSLVAANLSGAEKTMLEDFAANTKKAAYHKGKTDPSFSDFVPLGVTMPYSEWDWTDPLMYILVGNKYFTEFPELRKELDEHRDEIRLACIDNVQPAPAKIRNLVTMQPEYFNMEGKLDPVVYGIIRMAFYIYTEKWLYSSETRTDQMMHSMSDPSSPYYESPIQLPETIKEAKYKEVTRKPLW